MSTRASDGVYTRAKVLAGIKGQRHCSYCGETGHNKTGCKKRAKRYANMGPKKYRKPKDPSLSDAQKVHVTIKRNRAKIQHLLDPTPDPTAQLDWVSKIALKHRQFHKLPQSSLVVGDPGPARETTTRVEPYIGQLERRTRYKLDF